MNPTFPRSTALLRAFASLLCLFALLASAFAQEPASADTAKTAAPAKTGLAHRLTVSDKISVSVFGEEGLSTIARVDGKGTINLKLVGEVSVVGKTVAEAQKAIETSYREQRFLKYPQVTLNIEEYAERWVSIEGMVRSPGRIPLPIDSSMTVLDVVSKAGGLLDTARGTAITITRVGPDGKRNVFTVDVESLIKGRDKAKSSENLVLEPGDIIYVPQRLI